MAMGPNQIVKKGVIKAAKPGRQNKSGNTFKFKKTGKSFKGGSP